MTTGINKNFKQVGVLSYSNVGNFGDRLGMHLLSSIMPSNTEIERIYFKPWVESKKHYDLLILGIGNSLFAPLLNDQVFTLVRNSDHSVGIFGTQYREEFKPEKMRNLIRLLDYWFARYQDDLDLYAIPETKCIHLGDWLIREFMMTVPTEKNKILKVGQEIWEDLPMDRTIQQIQQFRRVYSERLHPLLCALTSAEEVAYKDQRESGSGITAGKFQSMLNDIFGRSYPEDQFWLVNKGKVRQYRERVIQNIKHLEVVLRQLLS